MRQSIAFVCFTYNKVLLGYFKIKINMYLLTKIRYKLSYIFTLFISINLYKKQ